MEIKLESSGYRSLFEYVKKEGVEPALDFFKDVNKFHCTKKSLLENSIIFGKNDLIRMNRRNRDIVKYIREHKKDMEGFNLANEDILMVLSSLQENNALVDLYLENARRLEYLKVQNIEFKQFLPFEFYNCGITRNKDGQIIAIQKNYTDGKINSVGEEKLAIKNYYYSEIPYMIENEGMTFLLEVVNSYRCSPISQIKIKDFGFNSEELPTKEEINSYDIPLQLRKK